MAAGDITEKVLGTFGTGLDFYACNVVNNGITVVTVNTGMLKVLHVFLTFAGAPANGTTCELFYTVSGGTISIDCAAASGAVKVSLLALGYRG